MGREKNEAADNRPIAVGLGARIMPVQDGWKVDYFSLADFERDPGTTYGSLEEALRAVADLLPRVNTEEQRAKARDLEEILWAQLDERTQAPGE